MYIILIRGTNTDFDSLISALTSVTREAGNVQSSEAPGFKSTFFIVSGVHWLGLFYTCCLLYDLR